MEIGTKVEVSWNDISVYDEVSPRRLAHATTRGTLARKTRDYIVIAKPDTLLTNTSGQTSVYPDNNTPPTFYYIPRSLVKKITTYE